MWPYDSCTNRASSYKHGIKTFGEAPIETVPQVLLVEDDREIRRFVRAALEADGYRVHEVETLKRGIIEAGTRQRVPRDCPGGRCQRRQQTCRRRHPTTAQNGYGQSLADR